MRQAAAIRFFKARKTGTMDRCDAEDIDGAVGGDGDIMCMIASCFLRVVRSATDDGLRLLDCTLLARRRHVRQLSVSSLLHASACSFSDF